MTAAFLLAALSSGRPARAAETLRVGTPEASAFVFSLLDVGVAAGTFAKHDIAIERVNFGGGGKLQQGMVAGQIDLAVTGGTDLALVAKGAPEKAVAAMAGAPVDMAIIVRSDNDVPTIADLRGKTIGVTTASSLTAWLAMELSRREGWGPDGVTRAAIGDMSGEVAALTVKNVDAIVGPVEGAYLLEQAGRAKPLTTFGMIDPFIAHIIFASDALIRDHPDTLRRFLLAWFDTVRFVRADKAKTIAFSQPVTKLPDAVAGRVYDIETPALSTTGRFDPAALGVLKRSFVELGLLEKLPEDSALVDASFLPKP